MLNAQAAPLEIDATGKGLLGMSPEVFLRDYWQKQPLLIHNAFPDFVSPIEPEDLAGLACEDGVLARLIEHDKTKDAWAVRHGPFAEEDFPGMPDHDWTLLVQDVDKWDVDVRALLAQFDFLPRWRIDDIMISFAARGGSVGAHVDQYDVFLLQAQGQRHWQIDAGANPPQGFRHDVELKLLREFHPSHDWVLQPGDMLYLPPGVPHHGVAVDACLTISVGMRAPAAAELLGDYVDTLAADAPDALRYTDADLGLPADPNEIDAAAIQRVHAALQQLQMDDPDRFGDWFGEFITTYRSAVLPVAADHPPSLDVTEQALAEGACLLRHPWSRMAWRRSHRADATHALLYAGGVSYPLAPADAQQLAAADVVDASLHAGLSDAGRNAVMALLAAGHYQLVEEDAE